MVSTLCALLPGPRFDQSLGELKIPQATWHNQNKKNNLPMYTQVHFCVFKLYVYVIPGDLIHFLEEIITE